MHLVEDPEEQREIYLEIDRQREEMYRELLKSEKRSRRQRKLIHEYRRGSTELWNLQHLEDIILDDGTYLEEVLCYKDKAIGFSVDTRDGFISFDDHEETRGRQIVKHLRWRWIHRIPVFGRGLRRRWARANGGSVE